MCGDWSKPSTDRRYLERTARESVSASRHYSTSSRWADNRCLGCAQTHHHACGARCWLISISTPSGFSELCVMLMLDATAVRRLETYKESASSILLRKPSVVTVRSSYRVMLGRLAGDGMTLLIVPLTFSWSKVNAAASTSILNWRKCDNDIHQFHRHRRRCNLVIMGVALSTLRRVAFISGRHGRDHGKQAFGLSSRHCAL